MQLKKILAILFALITWFAVITQFVLMMNNLTTSVTEGIIRFFSYFTILTNTLVALYFTAVAFTKETPTNILYRPGTLTAVTIYITMVGLVYQIALRHIWQPTGLQMVVDELLHTIDPILVIIFWYLYEVVKPVKYTQIFKWAIYPLVYLVYILIRGSFSNFYPYPFVNVPEIGMSKALTNAAIIFIAFVIISSLFLFIGKKLIKR